MYLIAEHLISDISTTKQSTCRTLESHFVTAHKGDWKAVEVRVLVAVGSAHRSTAVSRFYIAESDDVVYLGIATFVGSTARTLNLASSSL